MYVASTYTCHYICIYIYINAVIYIIDKINNKSIRVTFLVGICWNHRHHVLSSSQGLKISYIFKPQSIIGQQYGRYHDGPSNTKKTHCIQN